jgi:hypothetical protein
MSTSRTIPSLVAWTLLARLIFLGAGVYAAAVFPTATHDGDDYVAVPLPSISQLSTNIRDLHRSADEGWYISVAADGYAEIPFEMTQQNWCMFPLLPLIWRVLGLNAILLLITIYLANFCSTYLIWRTCRDIIGLDAIQSKLACLCFIFWPFSYQLYLTRAEPLLVTLTLAAFYFYSRQTKRSSFAVTLACVLLATSAKPNGFTTGGALIATEVLAALRESGLRLPSANRIVRLFALSVATVIPLVMLSYVLYVKTGNPLAWIDIQAAWAAPPHASFASALSAYFPTSLVARWGWDATFFNALLMYLSLSILIYAAVTQWGRLELMPMILQSGFVQIISGAFFFGYVFNRHSLPIVLNYVVAGSNRRLARFLVVIGASLLGFAGALAGLHIIHITA